MNDDAADKGEKQSARTERFNVRDAGAALVQQETDRAAG